MQANDTILKGKKSTVSREMEQKIDEGASNK